MDKQSIKIYVDNQLVGSAGYLDDFNKYGKLINSAKFPPVGYLLSPKIDFKLVFSSS